MDLEILRKIGLSEGEIKVYNALLNIGVTSINSIHEKVGMDRRNIYDILNKLIERGLVSYIEENGKRTFRISNPDKILSYIEEKKSSLEEVKNEVVKIIPSMQEMFESKKEGVFAEIFKGPEGLKAVWDDLLNSTDIYWIGSGLYVPERFPAYWKDWNKRRIRRKVESHHLFRYEKRKEVDKKLYTDCKFLPPEFSGNPTVTVIYENKVAQMLLGEEINVFVIESKDLAENYKKYHHYLWNLAKK
jgi:HTH-type transcriptional regulator, sugar sensing transcriptional regulator